MKILKGFEKILPQNVEIVCCFLKSFQAEMKWKRERENEEEEENETIA